MFMAGGSGTWCLCGERGWFSPFPSEQKHLRLKLGKQQGSAHRNSPSQLGEQSQAKIPGKGSRRSLGEVLPNPTGFSACTCWVCTLAGVWEWITLIGKRKGDGFLKKTGIGMLTQSRCWPLAANTSFFPLHGIRHCFCLQKREN